MCKVIFDSFDSEEQAVAFIDWFAKLAAKGRCTLATTNGIFEVSYDGVDTDSSDTNKYVVNVDVWRPEDDDN